MISTFAIYDNNGVIQRIVNCGVDEAPLQTEQDENFVEVPSNITDLTHYIDNGQLSTKLALPLSINKSIIAADGVDTITINNIPADTIITWWDDQQDIITDGILEITSDLEGEYKIILDHPHYLQETLTFEARN